ncbi:MAG: hypothetical protein J6Q37_02875 [Bacteroidales bacterium]|nr:hypothetical protein [Bacteroidales bacterium]
MQKEEKEQNEDLGRLKGITEITQSDDILSEMPVPQKPLADMLRKMNKSFLLSGNDVVFPHNPPCGDTLMQIVTGGPMDRWNVIMQTYMTTA